MSKADSFDNNVERYESWFDRNMPVFQSELEAVRALLPRFEKGLEIGVGTGRFAASLGARFGVDPSYSMGKAATKRGIEVILGLGEDVPFKESSLDVVLMITTVCFLDDVPAALKEAHRVLRKDGQILIGFIDRESLLGKIYEAHKKDNPFYRDATFLSAHELLRQLKEAGFGDFSILQTIFIAPADMKAADPVKPGYGEGSFVVVRGTKR